MRRKSLNLVETFNYNKKIDDITKCAPPVRRSFSFLEDNNGIVHSRLRPRYATHGK